MPTLEETIEFAMQAHKGQTDKVGQPYILHPLRIMESMTTEYEKMTALLHDVVEDTPYTLQDLRERGFPEAVVVAVDYLSRREDETYEDFIERIKGNGLAARVKLGDLLDNMDLRRLETITPRDVERMERYQRAWKTLTAFLDGRSS